jgi:hypothetical protein
MVVDWHGLPAAVPEAPAPTVRNLVGRGLTHTARSEAVNMAVPASAVHSHGVKKQSNSEGGYPPSYTRRVGSPWLRYFSSRG